MGSCHPSEVCVRWGKDIFPWVSFKAERLNGNGELEHGCVEELRNWSIKGG